MATNNEQAFNQNYKLRYSKEIELLDNLESALNEAANNLDIDKMESLISDFERKFYSDLRVSNRQSFDILKASAQQRILEIKKRKELLAQRQREIQATEDAYQKLQDIKKLVLTAKTTSELEKAKKKYEAWKNEIGRSRKIKFGWKYNKKVDNLKSAIDEGIGPEDAISELKNMIDRASHSGGFENDSQIKTWMNKYPENAFHEVYKKEVRDLTDKAFSLIKQPETENIEYLVALTPGFLFMSPTQAHAVNDLKNIMDKNSSNFKNLLEWIYTYRNVSFSEPYRQAISTLIPAEFGLSLNKQYSIPSFYNNKNLKTKDIKNLVKDTVINYFGILLCGNDLSSTKKGFIVDTFVQSQENETLSEITQTNEDTDKLIKAEDNSIISVTYSEEKKSTEITINDNFNEPTESSKSVDSEQNSLNVEITPISDTISTTVKDISPEIQVEISNILPDIEFVEEQITSSAIITDTTADTSAEIEEDSEELAKDTSTEKPENKSEKGDSFEITASYEEISDSAIEIPLAPSETISKKIDETSDSNLITEKNSFIQPKVTYTHELEGDSSETDLEIAYSETSEINSENINPYQLTEFDIDNIENLYSLVNSRTKQQIIDGNPSFETEEHEENDISMYQKIKD
ncbi:MAG: hypothetical protein IJN50_04760 [Clostridia bacterium]|nr:hypothetical protein [Clostridia bacterium]